MAREVNLQGSYLIGANLEGVNLQGAKYSTEEITTDDVIYLPTKFPEGFDPKRKGMIVKNEIEF